MMTLENTVLKYTNRKIWTFILLLPLFLMTAFRSELVGSDTVSYKGLYNIFANQSLTSGYHYSMEIGFRLLVKLLGYLNIGFYGFQVLYSVFIYTTLGIFFNRYSNKIAFSVFFFVTFRVFFFGMTAIRQMIAISIILISVKYILKRKFVKYLIFVLLASTFHLTSAVFILLYFMPFKKMDLKALVKTGLISLPVIIGANYILILALSIFPKYSSYLTRVESYDGIFVYLQTIFIFVFLILGFVQNKNNREPVNIINSSERLMLNATLYSFLLSLLSTYINIAGRVSKYLYIFIAVYTTMNFQAIKNSRERLIAKYVIISLLLIYYYTILLTRPEWDGVVPYIWMFF